MQQKLKKTKKKKNGTMQKNPYPCTCLQAHSQLFCSTRQPLNAKHRNHIVDGSYITAATVSNILCLRQPPQSGRATAKRPLKRPLAEAPRRRCRH